ncbi:MAG: hypothetical protein GQ544_00955, partial [Candidatus Aminicenantes bacterium]|nr:hypothetical protein [Candidatus Aminicenantes bacterium]
KRFNPETDRNFFLFFELAEYDAKIGEAVDWVVNTVLYPGDNLYIITPLKTYHLRPKAMEAKLREEISKELKGLIRQDTLLGNAEYRNVIEDLTDVTKQLSALMNRDTDGSFVAPVRVGDDPFTTFQSDVLMNQLLLHYADFLGRLDNMRRVDQMKLLDFAEYLKYQFGQKYVFMFYEQEFIPQMKDEIIERFKSMQMDSMDQIFRTMTLFDFHRRDPIYNVERVKRAYADASTAIHFLFFSRRPQPELGVQMVESSEDIFSAFREMAVSTGGIVDVSSRPLASLQYAIEASENYYLLYYAPKKYIPDGKFRTIKVTVKGKSLKVIHREGYYSN